MELKFLIFLFIISFPLNSAKKNPKNFYNQVQQINKNIRNGKNTVNDILILNRNGFLGEGSVGFVYAGIFVEKDLSKVPVAIKFVPKEKIQFAQNEIKIYKRLNAYKNPQIEEIGIPNVYYHGNWSSYHLIAMTKLDESLWDIQKEGEKLRKKIIHPLDIMIVIRNFVIQTKYMHGKGVAHGSVHLWHIMLRSQQSFLIDFKESHKMENRAMFDLMHEDWRSFIRITAILYAIDYCDYWTCFRKKVQNSILDDGLKQVIEKFGDEAFSKDSPKRSLNYDRLKELINEKIIEIVTFSWLSNSD